MTCLCSPVDLVINLRKISFAPELFTDPENVNEEMVWLKATHTPVIKRVVKHCSELVPGQRGFCIHHLEASDVPDKFLQPPETPVRVKPLLARHSVDTDIYEHLIPVRRGPQHPSLELQIDLRYC